MALVATEASAAEIDLFLKSRRPEDIAISDFARAEFAAAMARRVRMGELAEGLLPGTMQRLDDLTHDWTAFQLEARDLQVATEIVLRYRSEMRLPDAIYVAVARRTGAALVTLDRQQHLAALTLGDSVAGPLAERQ